MTEDISEIPELWQVVGRPEKELSEFPDKEGPLHEFLGSVLPEAEWQKLRPTLISVRLAGVLPEPPVRFRMPPREEGGERAIDRLRYGDTGSPGFGEMTVHQTVYHDGKEGTVKSKGLLAKKQTVIDNPRYVIVVRERREGDAEAAQMLFGPGRTSDVELYLSKERYTKLIQEK